MFIEHFFERRVEMKNTEMNLFSFSERVKSGTFKKFLFSSAENPRVDNSIYFESEFTDLNVIPNQNTIMFRNRDAVMVLNNLSKILIDDADIDNPNKVTFIQCDKVGGSKCVMFAV